MTGIQTTTGGAACTCHHRLALPVDRRPCSAISFSLGTGGSVSSSSIACRSQAQPAGMASAVAAGHSGLLPFKRPMRPGRLVAIAVALVLASAVTALPSAASEPASADRNAVATRVAIGLTPGAGLAPGRRFVSTVTGAAPPNAASTEAKVTARIGDQQVRWRPLSDPCHPEQQTCSAVGTVSTSGLAAGDHTLEVTATAAGSSTTVSTSLELARDAYRHLGTRRLHEPTGLQRRLWRLGGTGARMVEHCRDEVCDRGEQSGTAEPPSVRRHALHRPAVHRPEPGVVSRGAAVRTSDERRAKRGPCAGAMVCALRRRL